MIKSTDNVLHRNCNTRPQMRLVYNGIELIPRQRILSTKPTHEWHIPGGAIMKTGELIDLAKLRGVIIKIIDYTKRPL